MLFLIMRYIMHWKIQHRSCMMTASDLRTRHPWIPGFRWTTLEETFVIGTSACRLPYPRVLPGPTLWVSPVSSLKKRRSMITFPGSCHFTMVGCPFRHPSRQGWSGENPVYFTVYIYILVVPIQIIMELLGYGPFKSKKFQLVSRIFLLGFVQAAGSVGDNMLSAIYYLI